MTTRRSTGRELARVAAQLRDHPLGAVVTEDLAAAREHGRVTARIGITADGNPIIYSRDKVVMEKVATAVRRATHVHARHIPDLTVEQWEAIADQADAKLLPEGDDK